MAPPTAFEKAENDRAAIKDHLDFLDLELTRHAAIPLLQPEAANYMEEAAVNKTQLLENQRTMRNHAARGLDMNPHVTDFQQLLAKATRLHAAFHGINLAFPVAATPPPAAAAAPTGAPHQIRLPALELPKFSGNLEEWVSFRDLFITAIHISPLTKVEKFTQLKSLLTGEAARQVRSLVLSDANYDIAWKSLIDRYENNRELMIALMKRLWSQPVITTATAINIRSLIDTTKECIRSLEVLALPTQHWDALLFGLLFSKLDNGSRELWEQSLPDSSIPPLSKMYEFLEQRARALAASSATTSRQQAGPPPTHVRAHHIATSPCKLGCNHNHPLFRCWVFQRMPPQQRMAEVTRLNVCVNCIVDVHQLSDCPNHFRCKTCNGNHHTMLHPDQDAPDGQQQDSFQQA